MNFIERFLEQRGFIRRERAVSPGIAASMGTDPFTIWRSTKKIPAAKAMEVYTGWVYASIRAIGLDVAGMQHKLFRVGREQDAEIYDHELLNLLEAPNDYQTGWEMRYTTLAHLELTGNAYWFMEGVNSETGKPTALHIMNPGRVKVLVNRDAFPSRIEGYQYTLSTHNFTFKAEQVIHFKYPDPNDPYEGIGTVQSIGQWVDADNYAQEFNRGFFKNGARIGGFLESESAYTPEQLTYLKESFRATHEGAENAYKIAALPKGVKYTEAGSTQKELDFVNSADMMRDRIIAAFKVPRTALGITDDVNRANAEATNYVFALRTIEPAMKTVTLFLNNYLVPRYGDELYLGFENPVPEDRVQKADEMVKATGGSPVLTPNEAREEYFDLEPVVGGDVLQQPFNLVPLGATIPETAPQDTPQDGQEGKHVIRTRYAMNAKRRAQVGKDFADKAAKVMADILARAKEVSKHAKENISQLTDDEYEVLYKAFAIRVTPYEKKYKSAVEQFNAKQRGKVLARLEQITKAVDKKDIFDMEEEMAAFVHLTRPVSYDLAGKEGKEAAALLGISDMDILTPEVRRALDKSIELLARSYNRTTRDLLKAKLDAGLKLGLSQAELAAEVNAIYDYSDDVRALAVARTETFRVANYSTQEAWRQSGVVNAQIWYTAADERVCPFCGPLHGKVVQIDDDFFKKGDTITGSDGSSFVADYSDVGAPPLHTQCRCYIRPTDIRLE